MGLLEEFKARNFSLYAQWLGLLSILLLAILGGVTLATNTVFAIVGWVFAFMLVFVEVPFCTKFCPTSPKFDKFVSVFENSYYRGILYLILAIVMFVSKGLLIIAGVTLLLTAISYAISGYKKQPHASSSVTGGDGVQNV